MAQKFSIVVPVYNRPEELRELLESLRLQSYTEPFEVVVVEDGSQREAGEVVGQYADFLDIQYLKKPNTGPGDSRNYGMRHARGTYFILVDSDCILPPDYLHILDEALAEGYTDCFGGRDAAHPSFNAMQKAISYTMTAPITTGGIRGGKGPQRDFQPRSFNMGLSKAAFSRSGGFGNIHPGEDPDLSLRLVKLGFTIRYLPQVVVYHKRRIDFPSFFRQVYRFGLARPILSRWHPGTGKPTFWLPTLFVLATILALALPWVWASALAWVPLGGLVMYLVLVGVTAAWMTGSVRVGWLATYAVLVQFWGYGLGFLKSTSFLTFSNKKPEVLFPGLFFKP